MIRHYGLKIGDVVEFDGQILIVAGFHPLDNNRAFLREAGEVEPLTWGVAEWCNILVPAEYRA